MQAAFKASKFLLLNERSVKEQGITMVVLLKSVTSVGNLNFYHIRSSAGNCAAKIYWYISRVCIHIHFYLCKVCFHHFLY